MGAKTWEFDRVVDSAFAKEPVGIPLPLGAALRAGADRIVASVSAREPTNATLPLDPTVRAEALLENLRRVCDAYQHLRPNDDITLAVEADIQLYTSDESGRKPGERKRATSKTTFENTLRQSCISLRCAASGWLCSREKVG